MNEKLQFMPTITDALAIATKNMASIVVAVLLWAITIWIPYVNVGTTIALATLPVKLSKGEVISPTFIFDSEYRHIMGEYFILQAIIGTAVSTAMLFMIIPGIVLGLSWMLAVYLLLGKKMNWADCLPESNRLMMGYKFKVCCIKFAVLLVAIIIGVIIAKIFSGFLCFLLLLLFVVLIQCVSISIDAVIYRELVLTDEEKEETTDAF